MGGRSAALSTIVGALLLAGCQDGVATDDWEVCPLAVSVQVAVKAGQPPQVAWSPDCRLHAVVFGPAGDEEAYLWTTAAHANEMVGPVTYGRPPARSTGNPASAPTLSAGGYRVVLYEVVPGFPAPVDREIGRTTFTIP